MATKNFSGTIRLRKTIVPFDKSNPQTEPLFVNQFAVTRFGMDAFVDVGVIPVDSLDEGSAEDPELEFFVLTRLAMSLGTLKTLADQINALLREVKFEWSATDDGFPSSREEK